MAFIITEHCINCEACKIVCPKHAIYNAETQLAISHRCDECSTLSSAHCASICPIENAITTATHVALNPTGSLKPDLGTLTKLISAQETLHDRH